MDNFFDLSGKTVLISRTDSIGDVVLTLPMCVWIKAKFPTAKILFLGQTYTKPVLECLPEIDQLVDWTELTKMPESSRLDLIKSWNVDVCIHVFPNKEVASLMRKAKIPMRVGTSHRTFHFLTCNHRVSFTRKNSDFHESQLNFELLRPFGITELPSLEQLTAWMESFRAKDVALPAFLETYLTSNAKRVILHPRSQGSALEWPIEKYAIVANDLLDRGFQVFFTGTETDGIYIRSMIPKHENCVDTTGKLSLDQLLNFISKCDYLVACSTGPLHLAGVFGLKTIGLYAPQRPIHPGRWKALGKNVHILVNDENTEHSKIRPSQNAVEQIESFRVIELIN